MEDVFEPVTEPAPLLQRGRWHGPYPWSRTAVSAAPYNDLLGILNDTPHAWTIWHRYHPLGILPAGEARTFSLVKAGRLVAQQFPAPPGSEYIFIDLEPAMARVQILDISGGEAFYAFQAVGVPEPAPVPSSEAQSAPWLEATPDAEEATPIEDLGFSAKTENILKRRGIVTVQQLTDLGLDGLASLRELGNKRRKEVLRLLIERRLL